MRETIVFNKLLCPLCENSECIKLLHSTLRYACPSKVYQCTKCSFTFLYPMPNQEELNNYYRNQYRIEYQDISVQERFCDDLAEASARLQRIENEFKMTSALLEIGSGSGAFLSLAKEKFGYVAGIEPDTNTTKFLKEKKLNIFTNLREVKEKHFDLIVLFHVLEHLPHPVTFLKDLTNCLNDGGKIIIEAPNVDDALVSFYNIEEFKNFYFCSAHLSYFSKKTLEICAHKAGLDGKISQIQRYDLNNHLHWLKFKKPGILPKNIFSETTMNSYKKDLISQEIGDTLWGTFHKI